MNKEEILFRLKAITRELTCMNMDEFEKYIIENNFKIEFDQMGFSEKSKIRTTIQMKKTIIE